MTSKILNSYMPPEHFQLGEKLPSIVQEAGDNNTELWLIRIPANEVGQADLLDKRLKLKVDVSEGKLGHFRANQGHVYNIVKHRKNEMQQAYAVIPNGSDPFIVKKISCQVGFVRSLTVEDSDAKSEKLPHLQKDFLDSHTSDLTIKQKKVEISGIKNQDSEKEEIEAKDIENPRKKKHRRSDRSERI